MTDKWEALGYSIIQQMQRDNHPQGESLMNIHGTLVLPMLTPLLSHDQIVEFETFMRNTPTLKDTIQEAAPEVWDNISPQAKENIDVPMQIRMMTALAVELGKKCKVCGVANPNPATKCPQAPGTYHLDLVE